MDDMHAPLNRRDRRKAETRQRISDVATQLFARRGFDAVTVNEIADAADVSKVTVFNHFPRKEDMLLDRAPEARALLENAVRSRPAGTSPVEAIRRDLVARARREEPLGGFADRFTHFWRMIAESPALQARARELYEELELHLATVLAAEAGHDAPQLEHRLSAALCLSAFRVVYLGTIARMLTGEPAADVVDDHIALTERAFAAVQRALEAPPTA
ncbi:helix-turn-helix domain-containing protein [Glycomyces sp. NPDC047369]